MGFQIPLRKKVTLIPNSRDPHEIPDDFQWFPFYFIILMPSFTTTISKAIRVHHNSLAVLYVLVYVSFFLLRLRLSKHLSLPKNEENIRKFWMKLDAWFLYTAVTFGFVYQFADFSPLPTAVAIYIVLSVCCSFMFFVFAIVDLVTFWRRGEDETALPENKTIDAGKLNYYSIAISEKA